MKFRKTIQVVLILMFVLVFVLACGQKQESDDYSTEIELPASFLITEVSTNTKGETELYLLKNDKNYKVIINEESNAYYDSSDVSINLLKPDQTVYIDGTDSKNIRSIIITDWPGMNTAETPMVRTEPEDVLGIISEYLYLEHPELGILPVTKWTKDESVSMSTPPNHIEYYRFGGHILMIRWKDHEFPDYNMMIVSHLEDAAYWSGRLNEYGKIEENFYEMQ